LREKEEKEIDHGAARKRAESEKNEKWDSRFPPRPIVAYTPG
jgi:hypothetical protein